MIYTDLVEKEIEDKLFNKYGYMINYKFGNYVVVDIDYDSYIDKYLEHLKYNTNLNEIRFICKCKCGNIVTLRK